MIISLWLRNFRRFENERFDLRAGLNVIDGENNAGKTTLLHAIQYALFNRVSQVRTLGALMRPGAEGMGVELVFLARDGARYRLQRVHVSPPRAKGRVVGHFTLKQLVVPDEGEGEGDEGEGDDETTREIYVLSSDFQDREEDLALKLQELLGLSRRLFEVAIHFRQGRIIDILDGASKLDHVLGVTASVAATKVMRAMALEREKEATQLGFVEETCARLTREIEGAEARRGALDAEATSLSSTGERSSAALKLLDDLAPRLEDLSRALDPLTQASRRREDTSRAVEQLDRERARLADEGDAETLRVVIDDCQRVIRQLEIARGDYSSRAEQLDRGVAADEQRRGDLQGRIRRRESLPGGSEALCETCGQLIDGAHTAREIATWREELAALDEAVAGAERQREVLRERDRARAAELNTRRAEETRARQRLEALEALDAREADAHSADDAAARAIDAASAGLAEAVAAYREAHGAARVEEGDDEAREALASMTLAEDATGDPASLAGALSALRGQAQGLRASAEAEARAAKSQRARIERDLEEAATRATTLTRDLAKARSLLDDLQSKRRVAERLRTFAAAFKEVQLRIRERAADQLARDTFALHQRLAAPSQELEALSIDPTRYTVNVTPRDIGREVPAVASQGGGQQMLLALAFKFAIARVVGPCPFVLLDEPTYGLDTARRRRLLERIGALDIAAQTLLITHHDLGEGGHRVRVAKRDTQSLVNPSADAGVEEAQR